MRGEYWKAGTACFLMNSREVREKLPGWRLPPPLLPSSKAYPVKNPYTGEPLGMSRLPPDLSPDVNALRAPDLSGLAWIPLRSLMPDAFESFGEILLQWSPDEARDELHRYLAGPDDTNDVISIFPEDLLHRIAGLSAEAVADVAEHWTLTAGSDWVGADVAAPLVSSLAQFFRAAVAEDRSAYFWSSR